MVRQLADPHPGDTVLLAKITLAEVVAALAVKHRLPGGITLAQRDRALSLFLQDCDTGFLLQPVDRTVLDRAVELTQNHHLRGYDAVQLASALVAADVMEASGLRPLIFVTGDGSLLKAAAAENLPVDNPLDHP